MSNIEGHEWQLTPELEGSDVVSCRYLPPTAVLNISLMSTGGPQQRPGDYQWGNHRLSYEKAGQWGFLRVLEPGNITLKLLPDRQKSSTVEQANLRFSRGTR